MSTVASSSNILDVPTLVSQLMSLERRPIDQLNARIDSYQTKISSFGTISGLVSSFQSSLQTLNNSLGAFSATPSDTSILSASASSAAVAGTYSLNVTSLAQSQNLVAAGQVSSTSTIGTGTATTVTFDFGTINGTLKLDKTYDVGTTFTSNGTGTKSITIDGTNNTLEGIRDTVNAASIGVTATIVNDGSGTPYHLVFTSNTSGISNSIKITTDGGDATIDSLLANDPAGIQHLSETVSAKNAEFTVNGIAISKTTNNITDAIQGVTLTLKNLTTSTAKLTVARDTSAVSTAASGFVDAYNALANQLKSRSAYSTASTQGGALAGDGTIRFMQQQLRGILGSPATPAAGGSLTMLAQVGITYQTDGTLRLDSGKLFTEMTNNFSDVSNLFASPTGFTTRLKTWTTSTLATDGSIAMRTDNIKKSIDSYNNEINRLEARMKALQKQYTTTYSNLNLFLSSMNNTSSYLSSQFSKGAA